MTRQGENLQQQREDANNGWFRPFPKMQKTPPRLLQAVREGQFPGRGIEDSEANAQVGAKYADLQAIQNCRRHCTYNSDRTTRPHGFLEKPKSIMSDSGWHPRHKRTHMRGRPVGHPKSRKMRRP